MRQSARPARIPRTLPEPLHQRLNSYALAAGAAGVGLVALAQPAEARIVYTRTHHVIGNSDSFKLDVNHDGKTDLTVQNKYFHTCTTTDGSCRTSEQLTAKLPGGNQVVYNAGYGAVAIKPGVRIGPKSPFHGGLENMAAMSWNNTQVWGSWINVKNRYLGLKFKIHGRVHYGWARLSVNVQLPLQITATLTGYAYETIPNKTIIAGKTHGKDVITVEPGTLGHLARGASAIKAWRQHEKQR